MPDVGPCSAIRSPARAASDGSPQVTASGPDVAGRDGGDARLPSVNDAASREATTPPARSLGDVPEPTRPTAPDGVPAPPELPSAPERPHEARWMAESFGADPARYDRARPRYPHQVLERIVAACPGRDVLDVGTGTGILARQLVAAGCRVLGVDVDERMAAFARGTGLTVEVAPFEAWDPAGRVFDAVVAGQTWHWVEPLAGALRAALALRSGGRFAALWNAGSPDDDLAAAFAAVYRRVVPEVPMFGRVVPAGAGHSGFHDVTAQGLRASSAFREPERWDVSWERTYTRDEWLDQLPTSGGHSRFPADRLAALLEGVGAAIDEAGGSFVVRYTTIVTTAARA